MSHSRSTVIPLVVLCLSLSVVGGCARTAPSVPAELPDVDINDNRRAAGAETSGTLTLQLDIAEGMWRPEDARPPHRILAFGETGKRLSNPAPLLRVRQGASIAVTIRNRSPHDLTVHGLYDRGTASTELKVAGNATAVATFKASAAGTYFYWATRGKPLDTRDGNDSQLSGAFIVDPVGAPQNDRVFVLGHYRSEGPTGTDAWVINGRSWPNTERLSQTLGDIVRWRWINPSTSSHPMHLHGQYFRVTTDGDNHRDIARTDRPSVVATDNLPIGSTMVMEWTAGRVGNWLFHCHNLFHVIPDNRLPLPQWYDEYAKLPHDQHMFGLVMGMTISGPDPSVDSPAAAPRRMTLRVAERPGIVFETEGLKVPGLGYALDNGPTTAPGPALVLERGRPVEITVENHISRATSVHWHGIELDSYYDGVPHWGGDNRRRTPYIEPGKSFVARFTPPRAGTFMYHTHFNEFAQLGSGLYGALIVVEPGTAFDRTVDHSFVISRGGVNDDKDPVLINGDVSPAPITIQRGVKHRVRLMGITPVQGVRVQLLMNGDTVVRWRALAKDGADLPADKATSRDATLMIAPGETYDFELLPTTAGELRLEVELRAPAGPVKAVARLMVR